MQMQMTHNYHACILIFFSTLVNDNYFQAHINTLKYIIFEATVSKPNQPSLYRSLNTQ